MRSLRLRITYQDGRQQAIDITDPPFIIGSSDDCNLAIKDPGVAPRHAELIYAKESWHISDDGSALGTYVNDERLFELELQRLADGNVIKIGTTVLEVSIGPDPDEQTAQQTDVSASPAPADSDNTALLSEVSQLLFTPPAPDPDEQVHEEAESEAEVERPEDPSVWLLLVTYRSGQHQEFVLPNDRFTIGRSKDNNLVLTDPNVSRNHAQMIASDTGWQIRDLGSVNGTFVGGQRLAPYARHDLAEGSQITIGSTDITLNRKVWQLQVTSPGGRRPLVALTTSPFRIGRTGDNDLEINDGSLADHHVELLYSNHSWQICDLDSQDGTYVDNVRLISQYPYPLTISSTIAIGRTKIVLTMGTHTAASDAVSDEAENPSASDGSAVSEPAAAPQRATPSTAPFNLPKAAPRSSPSTSAPPAPSAPATASRDAASAEQSQIERIAETTRKTWLDRGVAQPLKRLRTTLGTKLGFSKLQSQVRAWTGVDPLTEAKLFQKNTSKQEGEAAPTSTTASKPAVPPSAPAKLTRKPVAPAATPAATPATSTPTAQPNEALIAQRAAPQSELFRLAFSTPTLQVEPGGMVSAGIAVSNRSTVVDRLSLSVVGIPPAWATIVPQNLPLMPGTHGEAQIVIAPPKSATSVAGPYYIAVAGRSEKFPQEQGLTEAVLQVSPFTDFHFDVQPKQLTTRHRAAYRIELANTSNHAQTFQLQGSDEEQALSFDFGRSIVTLDSGKSEKIRLNVTANKWHIYGPQKIQIFNLQATPADQSAQPQQAIGRFVQRPLLTCLLIAIIVLTLLACLVTAALLWLRDDIVRLVNAPQQTAQAQTATTFADGIATGQAQTATVIAGAWGTATTQAGIVNQTAQADAQAQTASAVIFAAGQTATTAANAAIQTSTTAANSALQTATAAANASLQTATAIAKPTLAPTATITPTATLIPPKPTFTPDLVCPRFVVTAITGNADPNSELLLYFNNRAVSGGVSDSRGTFSLGLIVGDEASGVYPVVVRDRRTRHVLRQLYCQVP